MSEPESTCPSVDELWKEFSGSLASYFGRRVARAEDVEDLVQETFLRIQSGLGDLADCDRIAAWVQRIARNVLVDSYRRRRPEATEDLEALPDDRGGDEDLTRRVASWLVPVIDGLDPTYGDVLRRSELEGERHREIASDLGLSRSAVKSRVQRGRERIRRSLEACCRFEFDRRGGVVDYRRRDGDPCGC